MATTQKTLTFDEAIFPATQEPTPEVLAWQMEKIRAGLKDADEGSFASAEEIRAIVQQYIPNG